MNVSYQTLAALALAVAAGTGALAQAQAPARTPAAAVPAAADAVEPEAVQALERMRAYLGTLTTFEVTSDTTQDVVLDNDQKVQIDGVLTYRVKRPNGFEIRVATGNKVRDFYYDGRQLTVHAPKLGYYAQAPAPPTIRQTLAAAEERYGIVFPLAELFHWSEPGEQHAPLQSAMVLGDATIGGVQTAHYAFRQGDYDWEAWIEKGSRPLPRKVVIVDRTEPTRPAYTTRLNWNLNAPINAQSFAFQPSKTDKAIQIAAR